MCGRYAVAAGGGDGTAAKVRRRKLRAAGEHESFVTYNARPGTLLPVEVWASGRESALMPMHWGFVPEWDVPGGSGPHPINARSETAFERRMFASALRERRCLVPMRGWYEWTGPKSDRWPYFVSVADVDEIHAAAIWSRHVNAEGEPFDSFAILTRAARPNLVEIHHREPVILAPAAQDAWLDPGAASSDLRALIAAEPMLDAQMWRVSRAVNAPGADGPELIAPVEETGPAQLALV